MGALDDAKFGLTKEELANLRTLISEWTDRPPVLFVGAGVTTHCALRKDGGPQPADWSMLQKAMAQRLSEAGVRDLPSDPLRLADLYEQAVRPARLIDLLVEKIRPSQLAPGRAHRLLATLPWAAIVTTNYDDVMEQALHAADRGPARVLYDEDLAKRRGHGIVQHIYVHGAFSDPRTIVLTEESYRRFERDRPGVATKVRSLLLEHPLLFVGFSLTDPNIGRLLGWLRDTSGKHALPSIAIVHRNITSVERSYWQSRAIDLVRCAVDLDEFIDALCSELAWTRRTPSPAIHQQPEPMSVEAAEAVVRALRSDTGSKEGRVASLETSLRAATSTTGALKQLTDALWEDNIARERLRILLDSISPGVLEMLARSCIAGHQLALCPGYADSAVAVACFGNCSDVERTDLMLRWWQTQRNTINSTEARSFARLAMDFRGSLNRAPELLDQLELAIRDAAFVGLEADLLSQLHSMRGNCGPRAISRVAADALMLGRASEAAALYGEASATAINVDDRAIAGLGLAISRSTDSSSWEHLEDTKLRFPAELRKELTRIEQLEQRAAKQIASESEDDAESTLLECIWAYRALGMPQTVPSDNLAYTTPTDSAARLLVRTIARRKPSGLRDPAKSIRALELAIRHGLTTQDDLPFADLIEDISRSGQVEDLRRIVLGTSPAWPRAEAARQTLRILTADLLTDDEIAATTERLVQDSRTAGDDFALWRRLDLSRRWGAFATVAERAPLKSMLTIVSLASSFCTRGRPFNEVLDAIHLGLQPPAKLQASSEVAALTKLLVRALESAITTDDQVQFRQVARCLFRLNSLQLLSTEQVRAVQTLATAQLDDGKAIDRFYRTIEWLELLAGFDDSNLVATAAPLKNLIEELHKYLRSSHAKPLLNVLRDAAPKLDVGLAENALRLLRGVRPRSGDFFDAGDLAKTQSALAMRCGEDVADELRALGQLDVRAIPAMVAYLASSSPEVVERAVVQISRFSIVAGDQEETRLVDAYIDWLRLVRRVPSSLEPHLISHVARGSAKARFRLVRELRWQEVAWEPAMPAHVANLLRSLAEYGTSPSLRAAAILLLAKIGHELGAADVHALIERMTSDTSTYVRRAAEYTRDVMLKRAPASTPDAGATVVSAGSAAPP